MSSVFEILVRVVFGVKTFVAARPDATPGIRSATTKLVGLADAMRALGQQQGEGGTLSQKAVDRATELRRFIRLFLLQPVALIAADAFQGQQARVREFRMVRSGECSKETFLLRARAIHAAVVAAEPVFLQFDMDPGLPALLNEALAEYAALPEQVTDGLRTRAGARDGLESQARKLMTTLRRLDGLVLHHYRDDPATLAEWKTVRNVPWPGSTKVKTARAAKAAANTTPPESATGTNA